MGLQFFICKTSKSSAEDNNVVDMAYTRENLLMFDAHKNRYLPQEEEQFLSLHPLFWKKK
jgi:hypothetical protein